MNNCPALAMRALIRVFPGCLTAMMNQFPNNLLMLPLDL